jgi:hypothetical protein
MIARKRNPILEKGKRLVTPVLIEIRAGEYLGEDDTVRLRDDYGRPRGQYHLRSVT